MAYKEASVNAALARIDARIARIETIVLALAGGAPVQAEAATTATPATEAVAKVKVGCTLHPEKRFALTPAGDAKGSGFHFAWCKGSQVA